MGHSFVCCCAERAVCGPGCDALHAVSARHFQSGTKVSLAWEGARKDATISHTHADGHYDVLFEDGGPATRVCRGTHKICRRYIERVVESVWTLRKDRPEQLVGPVANPVVRCFAKRRPTRSRNHANSGHAEAGHTHPQDGAAHGPAHPHPHPHEASAAASDASNTSDTSDTSPDLTALSSPRPTAVGAGAGVSARANVVRHVAPIDGLLAVVTDTDAEADAHAVLEHAHSTKHRSKPGYTHESKRRRQCAPASNTPRQSTGLPNQSDHSPGQRTHTSAKSSAKSSTIKSKAAAEVCRSPSTKHADKTAMPKSQTSYRRLQRECEAAGIPSYGATSVLRQRLDDARSNAATPSGQFSAQKHSRPTWMARKAPAHHHVAKDAGNAAVANQSDETRHEAQQQPYQQRSTPRDCPFNEPRFTKDDLLHMAVGFLRACPCVRVSV